MGQGGPGQQGHMPPFPNGFSPQEMNRLAYYQLMQQHQQKLFAMSLDKTDEFGRYSSPLCRYGERYLSKKNTCGIVDVLCLKW